MIFVDQEKAKEKTLYSLITYGGGANVANMQCSTSTFNPSQFLSMIRHISPGGGGLEESTHLVDALSVLDLNTYSNLISNFLCYVKKLKINYSRKLVFLS